MEATATTLRPCEECGGMVDLSAIIAMKIAEPDGSEVMTKMSEAEARDLLAELGIPAPPIICDAHERREIVTVADA